MKKILILFFISLMLLTHPLWADDMLVPDHGPQLRVYADREFGLPGGEKGLFLHAYGITIRSDGSEKVLWRTKIVEVPGIAKALRQYEYLHFQNYIYLFFPEGFERRIPTENPNAFEIMLDTPVFKFDRETGTYDSLETDSDEFQKLRERFQWLRADTVLRPALESPAPFEKGE